MTINYLEKLILGYLKYKNIDSTCINISHNKSIIIHITKLFDQKNYTKGLDLIQYINNCIQQVNGKPFHMQVIYKTDPQLPSFLEEVYLEFSKEEYNLINQKLAKIFSIE